MPAAPDFAPFKPHFVRALGAVVPRPTLARFEVQGGLRVVLRDAARVELAVRVASPTDAAGEVLRTERSAVDVVGGEASGEHHRAWLAAIADAVRAAEGAPAWPAFLAQAWST